MHSFKEGGFSLKSSLWKNLLTIPASPEEKVTSDFLQIAVQLSQDQILAACTYKTWSKHVLIALSPWHAGTGMHIIILWVWAQMSKPGLWTSPLVGCHLHLLAPMLVVSCLYSPFCTPLVPVAPSLSQLPVLRISFCLARQIKSNLSSSLISADRYDGVKILYVLSPAFTTLHYKASLTGRSCPQSWESFITQMIKSWCLLSKAYQVFVVRLLFQVFLTGIFPRVNKTHPNLCTLWKCISLCRSLKANNLKKIFLISCIWCSWDILLWYGKNTALGQWLNHFALNFLF